MSESRGVNSSLEQEVRRLPDHPGIYIFQDAQGQPLYVGKAKSLKKRVSSYLRVGLNRRLTTLMEEARIVDVVLTDTEAEALLIENQWIKKHRPRFNILLRDDKTYPYLKITSEPYPRITFTRRIRNDRAQYFGPYLPGGLARKAIKIVQKIFQIRVCRIPMDGSLERPCLYHDMKRCLAPCVAGLTTEKVYSEAVQGATQFLAGRTDELCRRLQREMKSAAESLDFEQAGRLRDLIADIDMVSPRQKLSTVKGEDIDIWGGYLAGGHGTLANLIMRGGVVIDRRELFFEGVGDILLAELMAEILPQYYHHNTFNPREIHVSVPFEGMETLAYWLSERSDRRIYLQLPSRGPKAHRLSLAARNAKLGHERRFRGHDVQLEALESLTQHLHLTEDLSRIEGFDISHFQGGETVASCVVWEEGKMRRNEYRSFNIRGLHGSDDFLSMQQVISRRYTRTLREGGAMPDLILIDGGRGQLNAALNALVELGVEEVPTVALAKREEEIYRPQDPKPLALSKRDPGLHLLREIRDEAHRFAVSRHQRRRRKGSLTSALDRIPGIGPKRRKRLLRKFGSLSGVSRASRDQLVQELGQQTGDRVWRNLHPENPDTG